FELMDFLVIESVRIKNAVPVFVRPASCANADLVHGFHSEIKKKPQTKGSCRLAHRSFAVPCASSVAPVVKDFPVLYRSPNDNLRGFPRYNAVRRKHVEISPEVSGGLISRSSRCGRCDAFSCTRSSRPATGSAAGFWHRPCRRA